MKPVKTKKVIIIIVLSIVGALIAINAYFMLAPQFGKKPDRERMAKLARNAVYRDGKFRNTNEVPVMLPRSTGKLIRMALQKHEGRSPDSPLPSMAPAFNPSLADSLTQIIWLGHSSVYIKMSGITILTDPVFSKRASPVNFAGPKPFKLENPMDPARLPLPDIIVLSHDHFDHLDHKAIRQYYQAVKLFIVPLGVRDHLERWGIPPEHILEFDWWQEENVKGELKITAAPAQHFSGRQKQDNATLWCSWIISNGREKVYFSGDSGYAGHFKAIGDTYGPFDLVLMECGAYGKYWPNIHMLPEQSVQAALDVQAKRVLPIHWGKYNLAFHPWKEPIERFVHQASEKKLDYTTPRIGETFELSSPSVLDPWWR